MLPYNRCERVASEIDSDSGTHNYMESWLQIAQGFVGRGVKSAAGGLEGFTLAAHLLPARLLCAIGACPENQHCAFPGDTAGT